MKDVSEKQSKAIGLKSRVDELEGAMLQMPQVSCQVIHRFGPGIYMREVTIPADTFAIGHHQNFEQLNIMLKGRVTIANDDGSFVELVAPLTFVGKPGRKIGYIHEDMVWLNVYNTSETDIEKLEDFYLTKSDVFLENVSLNSQLMRLKSEVDTADYLDVLSEFGFTEEQAKLQAHNQNDMTELPLGGYKIKVGSSSIEGKGLIATADIKAGEEIAPARINGLRTIAGRYTNHAKSPNAKMIKNSNGNITLQAVRDISGSKGGCDGEEITINYRDALQLTMQIGKD